MTKRLLILLLLSSPVFAARIYQHDDPKMNDELDKVYHDQLYLRAVNVQASSGTFTYLNISTITVTNVAVSSLVANNFTATASTFTALKVTGAAIIPWMTDWTTETFTVNQFGTAANSVMWCRRVGDSLECRFYFDAGTVTAQAGSITLPNSLAIDTNKIPASNKATLGYFTTSNGAGQNFFASNIGGFLGYNSASASQVFFMKASTDASDVLYATVATNALMNSNGAVGGWFIVPISGWTAGQTL